MKAPAVLFLLLASLTAVPQSLTVAPSRSGASESEIPTPVRTAFSKENPEVIPNWKVEGGFFKATYVDPASNLGNVLIYSGSGEAVRRERELESSEVPVAIKQYFEKNFPGESFVIWSRLDNAYMQTYYAHRSSRVLTFDKEGNYIGPKNDTVKPEEKIRVYGAYSQD
jgi:hypothetical protein